MKDLHSLDNYRDKTAEMQMFGVATHGELGKGNGVFKVFVSGKSFFVIASNGGGWDHVSVSRKNRVPTWDEMCAIKDMFFDPEEVAVLQDAGEAHRRLSHRVHRYRPICFVDDRNDYEIRYQTAEEKAAAEKAAAEAAKAPKFTDPLGNPKPEGDKFVPPKIF